MARSLDLGGVDMADPQSMETERQRVGEVDGMESGVGEELCCLCCRLEECSVCHGCIVSYRIAASCFPGVYV